MFLFLAERCRGAEVWDSAEAGEDQGEEAHDRPGREGEDGEVRRSATLTNILNIDTRHT